MIPSSRYLFFGGKGGVGKTTAACATALYLLNRSSAGTRILLFSTDPAHSLSDSLQKKIGDRVVEVARPRAGARLFAYEIEAKGAFEEFKAKHRHTLFEIARRGTFLDETDIQELLDLSLPGMDEVMALFRLGEVDDSENYDRIVVDTAPSGHTTRLFQLPAVFTAWTRALDRLAEKHRYMVAHFGRRIQEDEVDRLIRDLYRRIERVKDVLYGSETAFVMVSTPEIMSVEETRRYFDFLSQGGLRVTDLIVNRVEHTHGRCEYCKARVRRQETGLRRLRSEFSGLRSHEIPLLPREVLGVRRLKEFGVMIWNG